MLPFQNSERSQSNVQYILIYIYVVHGSNINDSESVVRVRDHNINGKQKAQYQVVHNELATNTGSRGDEIAGRNKSDLMFATMTSNGLQRDLDESTVNKMNFLSQCHIYPIH